VPYADYSKTLTANRERQKTVRGAANHAKANKAYRQRHALKYKAHIIVNNAVRDGLLLKGPCEVCGLQSAEAHHDDYSFPLRVRWLCQAHHKQWHRDHPEACNGRTQDAPSVEGEEGNPARHS
jgi:hypothetical protein